MEETGWDTTLTVQGINPLIKTAIDRSVVSAGSNGRLQAFLKKCRQGGDIRIGFIGGSVTAGAVATVPARRYSSQFCLFLGKLFPAARFQEVNAGIGGTDSRFGASRAREDMLYAAPDLVVIEFAVNNDPGDTLLMPQSYEGLIRQCLADPHTAVLLYFSLQGNGTYDGENKMIPTGLHYGLPMVSLMRAAWPFIQDSIISADSLITQVVHPIDAGHFMGAYTLFSLLRATAHQEKDDAIAPVPAPIYGTVYDTAGFYHTADSSLRVSLAGSWAPISKEQGRIGFMDFTAGPGMSFDYFGKEVTLGYHVTKLGTGRLEVSVNGVPVDTLSDYFAGDWGGGVMRFKLLHRSQTPQKATVTLTLLEGRNFQVDYLLYAGQERLP